MRSIYDAALILRNVADAAETADAAEAGVATDALALFHLEHDQADSPDYIFKAVVHNIVLGGDVAPTAAVFIFEVAATAAFSSGEKEIGRVAWASGLSTLECSLSMAQIRAAHASPKAIRVRLDLTGGTNPTVAYGAYLTKQ